MTARLRRAWSVGVAVLLPMALLAPGSAAARPARVDLNVTARLRTSDAATRTVVSRANAVTGPPAVTAATTEPTLRLVAESSTVGPDGTATFTVAVEHAPPGSVVSLDVYLPIGDDPTALSNAVRGSTRGQPFFPGLRMDATTAADEQHRVVLTVPTKDGEPNAFRLRAAGVYPVLIRLMAGRDTIDQLTTFLVRTEASTRPTDVAVVLPVDAAPTVQPDGRRVIPPEVRAQLAAIDRLGQAAAIPFTLAIRPDLLTALDTSTEAGDQALSERLKLIARRSQLVVDTAVAVDPTKAMRGGLAEVYTREVTAGRSQLRAWLGAEVDDSGTRFLATTPEPAGLALARSAGLATIIAPAALASDGGRLGETAVASGPVGLVDATGNTLGPGILGSTTFEQLVTTSATDTDTSAHFLTARQFLAGIQARAPFANGPQTGTVLVAPLRWTAPEGGVLQRLLELLTTSTTVRAVTVDRLLADVPAARTAAGNLVTRPLRNGPTVPTTDIGVQIALVRIDVAAFSSMSPTPSADPAALLDAAASTLLSDDQRRAYLAAAKAPTDGLRTAIQPILSSPITVNAGRVGLPLRLTTALTTPISVRVRLTSNKASFPENDQIVTLVDGLYQGSVLVDAREGRYPITVTVTPPGGEQVLAIGTITVRAYPWGGLGLALSVGFAAVLATWWFSHARAIRRRKRALIEAQQHPAAAGSD